ncbi:hypothetical protein CR513_21489, partial [Mucuna pruriens]
MEKSLSDHNKFCQRSVETSIFSLFHAPLATANAMLDLGASINVMPSSIYKSLNFGDLEPTGMVIKLANRSVVQLVGAMETWSVLIVQDFADTKRSKGAQMETIVEAKSNFGN